MNLLNNATLDALEFAHKINDGIIDGRSQEFQTLEATGYVELIGLPAPAEKAGRLTAKGEKIATALFGPGRRTARFDNLRKYRILR